MKTTFDVLDELEATGSRNEKQDIIEHNRSILLQDAFKAALDPYNVYNIRKFKMPRPVQGNCGADGILLQFLHELLPRLTSRELTGNAAKGAVEEILGRMTSQGQKWCKRILIKNLRCGVQSSTVNKVWPGLIRSFEVQLAHSLETTHEDDTIQIVGNVSYPVTVEPKLDGLRCIAIKTSGIVTLYTRNGRKIDTLPTITEALEKNVIDDIVLDGEALSNDWNLTASIIGSKKNAKNDDVMVYNVFDVMSLEEWSTQCCLTPFHTRQQRVKETCDKIAHRSIVRVEGKVVENESELLMFYHDCLDKEFEGIMIKDIHGLYEFKRSDAILKMKPVTTYEGCIVGHYEGNDGTARQGLFGGFNMVLPNGVVTRVGGGFNDKDRAEIQLNGVETYMGKVMEVEGQPPLTKDGKVRFPVFVRWRDPSDVDPRVTVAYENFVDKQTASDV